jgi:hypothetical protein
MQHVSDASAVPLAVPIGYATWYASAAPPTSGLAIFRSPERNVAVKLHGSPMCYETPFGAIKQVWTRVETRLATYAWAACANASAALAQAGAIARDEREAFARYHVARFTPPADAATRARRVACLATWYAAVEAMTATPLAELLVHGDVVVRMCEVFTCWVYPSGEVTFEFTHARNVRRESRAATTGAADVTATVADALGYTEPRAFLAAHRIVGVETTVGATGALCAKRKYGATDDLIARNAAPAANTRRKITVVPAGACAVPGCAADVGSVATMALCVACARRLRGVFHAHTRSFFATAHSREARKLREMTAAEREHITAKEPRAPTLPVFVEPPGPYHLPDDVAAHVLYVARLCKQRLASRGGASASAPTHALARGVAETAAGALDAASLRPGLEALYTRLRLRRALSAAFMHLAPDAERAASLLALCDRFRAGAIAPPKMTRAIATLMPPPAPAVG